MKITEVRTRVFEFPHPDTPFFATWQPFPSASHRMTLVEIMTDEGITGIGAGGVVTPQSTAAPLLIGQDPLDIERHAHLMRSVAYFMGTALGSRGRALGYRRQGGGPTALPPPRWAQEPRSRVREHGRAKAGGAAGWR